MNLEKKDGNFIARQNVDLKLELKRYSVFVLIVEKNFGKILEKLKEVKLEMFFVISLVHVVIITHIIDYKKKIKIVKMDAFDFAKTQMAGNFDFLFADIWHDAGDGRDLYLRMKAWESKYPDIRFSFWLEDTIKCYIDEDLWDMGQ